MKQGKTLVAVFDSGFEYICVLAATLTGIPITIGNCERANFGDVVAGALHNQVGRFGDDVQPAVKRGDNFGGD
jgi:hypothetical protein